MRRKLPEHPMAERLGYALKRAQHALRTSIDDQLQPLGLTTAQYNLLSVVAAEPGDFERVSCAHGLCDGAKHAGHALAIVKAQQDQKVEAKVLTNSEKTGYKKRPCNLYGPDHIEQKSAPTARRRLRSYTDTSTWQK